MTIKGWEENTGVNFRDLESGSTPKEQANKEKIDKLDFIKIKLVYPS